jgi:hypothetical protein
MRQTFRNREIENHFVKGKKMCRLAYVLSALIFAFGCASSKRGVSVTPLPFTEADKQEVSLAVWHYMFAHWKGHRFDFPTKFFLAAEEHDVPSKLLAQFQNEGFEVAPASHYAHGKGIHCSIEKVEWISSTEAKVWGGYLFGELGGEWGYFTLRKDNGVWVVISWEPTLFS